MNLRAILESRRQLSYPVVAVRYRATMPGTWRACLLLETGEPPQAPSSGRHQLEELAVACAREKGVGGRGGARETACGFKVPFW